MRSGRNGGRDGDGGAEQHVAPIVAGVSASFIGVGTFFVGTGIEMLRARSEESVVYSAPSGAAR